MCAGVITGIRRPSFGKGRGAEATSGLRVRTDYRPRAPSAGETGGSVLVRSFVSP